MHKRQEKEELLKILLFAKNNKDEKGVLYHKQAFDIVGLMGFDAPGNPIF
jgi:hypothetical protein